MTNDSIIWKWGNTHYRVHCANLEDYEHMLSWTGSSHGSVYDYPDGHSEWDVQISAKNYLRAVRYMRLDRGPSRTPEPVTNNVVGT